MKRKPYTTVNLEIPTLDRVRSGARALGATYSQYIDILQASAGLYELPLSAEGDAYVRFLRHIEYLEQHGTMNPALREILK